MANEIVMTQAEYEAVPSDYRGVWTTERVDLPDWPKIREQYMGKRTLFTGGSLLIEGMGLTIID